MLVVFRPMEALTAVQRLERWSRDFSSKGGELHVCVVSNSADAAGQLELPHGWQLLIGSNERAEFSGYREGVNACMQAGLAPHGWLILNDRFWVDPRTDLLPLFTPSFVAYLSANDFAAGRIDGPLFGGWWVRSNLIFVPHPPLVEWWPDDVVRSRSRQRLEAIARAAEGPQRAGWLMEHARTYAQQGERDERNDRYIVKLASLLCEQHLFRQLSESHPVLDPEVVFLLGRRRARALAANADLYDRQGRLRRRVYR